MRPLVLTCLALALAGGAAAFDHDHALLTRALTGPVADGRVDYAALRRDRTHLDAYLATLEAVTAAEHDRFSRDEKLAFWVNAYNAYTIALILDHDPVTSIRRIGRFWENVFRIEFIPLAKIRGKPLSLDTIEHDILRKEIGDFRIHAAVVCASRSCPALRATAYTSAGIEAELDLAMRSFLRDERRNHWDAGSRILFLSSIFKWFRDDFESASGSLLDFVVPYLDASTAAALRETPAPRIDFLDYDWSLNGR